MAADLFAAAVPRPDVLTGELTDAIFAANLDDVVENVAPEVYGDASRFFETTYPSKGLKELLDEVFGRLTGKKPSNASIIRVETNLGGGKTHNLIALLHVARGGMPDDQVSRFMSPDLLPDTPIDRLGVFVGSSVGATDMPEANGIKARTPWGFLAASMGGAEAYEHVREDDDSLTAPGSAAMGKVLGDGPALILIDEIARYLATAAGKTVGGSTLAAQTTSWIMALLEAVASKPKAVVVLTTTQVTDAFGEQTASVLEKIAEAESLIARKEHVLRPSEEADLPRILARRLFEDVDERAADEAASAYADFLNEAASRGAQVPERMTNASWAKDVRSTYPFHPDTITVLDKRLSTIPNFHRTRGALRLLARTVRDLWDERPDRTLLIHPHHISLRNRGNVEDLSSKIERSAFENVIRADIVSQPGGQAAHAEEIDAGKPVPYATRLATTAYLYSLTRDVPGATAATLLGDVLTPGDDPNVASKALDDLEATAWYLHSATNGYRFSTEITLIRAIQEAEREVQPTKVTEAATDLLARAFKDSLFKVRRVWEDAAVPDTADTAWLVLYHWEAFGDDKGVGDPADPVPAQVTKLWEEKPAGGLREFRNRLVFLMPNKSTHQDMLRSVRRLLALRALFDSPLEKADLPPEKQAELADLYKEAEAAARIAVCNHLSILYVPAGSADGKPRLVGEQLPVVTQASLRPNQTTAIEERLAAMEKTLSAGDKRFDPQLFKNKAGKALDKAMVTSEVPLVFARRADLKIVLDQAQLVALIAAGVQNGTWEYQDAEIEGQRGWATQDRPSAAFRISSQTFLHPVGSAPEDEDGDKPAGPKKIDLGKFGKGKPKTDDTFAEKGQAGHALATVRPKAVEANRGRLSAITLQVDEVGTQAREQLMRLLGVIGTMPGASIRYGIHVAVDLGPDDSLRVDYAGPPEGWASLRSPVDQALTGREGVVTATVTVTFGTPIDLAGQDYENLVQRAKDSGPSSCSVLISTTEDVK